MDPQEERPARELRDPHRELPHLGETLPGVLAGVRRRSRRRRVTAVGSGVVAVVVLTVAGLSLVGKGTPPEHAPLAVVPTQTTVSSPPVTAPTTTPATISPATRLPVPQEFTGSDLTFVSPDRGWALGTAPCRKEPCTSLLRTVDGGRTWTGGPAPVALLAPTGTSCGSSPCVSAVRFRDASRGWVFGNGPLLTTTDGGQHWSVVPGPATTSLEASGSDVLRVVTGQQGCPPGCTFSVQRAASYDGAWVPVTTPQLSGVRTLLLRHGDDAYVFAFHNPAGGAGTARADVVASADRGRTWTARTDPCSPPTSNSPTESDAQSAAIGPDGSLAVLCQARSVTGPVTVRVSRDRGVTYGAAGTLPTGVTAQQLSVSASALVAEVGSAGRLHLLRSTDAGRSWRQVAQAAGATQPLGSLGFLAFSDDALGRWLPPGSRTLWTSTDGGAAWTTSTFAR